MCLQKSHWVNSLSSCPSAPSHMHIRVFYASTELPDQGSYFQESSWESTAQGSLCLRTGWEWFCPSQHWRCCMFHPNFCSQLPARSPAPTLNFCEPHNREYKFYSSTVTRSESLLFTSDAIASEAISFPPHSLSWVWKTLVAGFRFFRCLSHFSLSCTSRDFHSWGVFSSPYCLLRLITLVAIWIKNTSCLKY